MTKRKSFVFTAVLSLMFFLGWSGILNLNSDSRNLVYAQSSTSPSTLETRPPSTSAPKTETIKPGSSQQPKPSPSGDKPKSEEVKASNAQPTVTAVYKFSDKSKDPVAINDLIVVEVSDFNSYYHKTICENKNPCSVKISLNLDGRKIPGITSEPIKFDKNKGILHFRLFRNKLNDEVWSDLIGSANPRYIFIPRKTLLSISLEDGNDATPIAVGYDKFELLRFRWSHLIFWGISLVLAWRIIIRRNLDNFLRESGTGNSKDRPYSLSRCQMLWWLILVVSAYVGIYMATGDINTINDTVLGLMGIGSLTTLGAVLIDSNDVAKPDQEVESKGLWDDLLNSKYQKGPGLHRLQLIIWTAILTVIFLVSVYTKLSMPELSPTLLALQGITSGTYLGFKFPENKQTN
jgi:hypothetical protein